MEKGNVDALYDNSVGSMFLADARAGVLLTLTQRAKFQDVETVCRLCKKTEETLEHVILKCSELGVREVSLIDALGSSGGENEATKTKKRLTMWKIKKSKM